MTEMFFSTQETFTAHNQYNSTLSIITLYSLALVWGVCADRVVSYELGLGCCSGVRWRVSQYVHRGVLIYRGSGWRVTKGAGPSPEPLWYYLTR